MTDLTEKQSQRAAYVAYVELYRRLVRLASGDPARAMLAEATKRAEARWRALMRPADDVVLDVSPVTSTPLVAECAAPTPDCEQAQMVSYSTISLAAWGG